MSLEPNINIVDKNCGFNLGESSSKENIFHAIYFVDSITGALLVSNKYSDSSCLADTCEDLISSFLNAMNLFINEIKSDRKNEELQEINFKEMRILYEKIGRVLCIAISRKTNLQLEREILHQILSDFYQHFESKINSFNGTIDPEINSYKKKLKNLNLNLKSPNNTYCFEL
jgi:hypothetical protein